MQLIRETWEVRDIEEFYKYLLTFSKGKQKGEWEKRIINTNLPCIAVPSEEVKKIIKQISKGNFLSFIKNVDWLNYTISAIVGGLICKIEDFGVLKQYLTEYANKVDNWAGCDCLKFNISKDNKKQFFNLSTQLIKNKKPFVRRIGLNILFKLLKFEDYTNKTFEILNSFYEEKDYYVNMMLAWLLCESFIKKREDTLKFLQNHNLNKFVINKTISKCRDSFRVSREDKEILKKFRQ